MCHRASEASAWRCSCGYEFGQHPETVCELLRAQRTSARIMLAVLIAIDLAALGGVIYGALHGFLVVFGFGFAALIGWTLRAVHKLALTGTSLRQLSKHALP